MLDAILVMIGYYVVILASTMMLLVFGVQIFKVLSSKKQRREHAEMDVSREPAREVGEQLGDAVAAVTVMPSGKEQASVNGWKSVNRDIGSPWKIASRSRSIISSLGEWSLIHRCVLRVREKTFPVEVEEIGGTVANMEPPSITPAGKSEAPTPSVEARTCSREKVDAVAGSIRVPLAGKMAPIERSWR
ncbi:hypothetical protein [[Eubacterium] cellulosolvens]